MGLDTWSGAEYADGGDGADGSAATLKLAQSIRSGLTVRFTTVSARNAATAAALALIGNPAQPYAAPPIHAFVDDLGGCYYDGNTETGTGGWRWIGGARKLLEVGPLPFAYTTGGTVAVGDSAGTLGYSFDTLSGTQYRLIQITHTGVLRPTSATAALSGFSWARVHVWLNDNPGGGAATLNELTCQADVQGVFVVVGGEGESRSASYVYRMRGPHLLQPRLAVPVINGSPAGAECGVDRYYLQVLDLGPTQ